MLPELKIKFGLQFGIFFTFSNIKTITTNPHFSQKLRETYWLTKLEWTDVKHKVVRENTFSLEVLAAVKVASCGFNLETLGLPRMIKEKVKKFQDLIILIKSYQQI